MPDYSALDQSSAINYIFYPRRDFTPCPRNSFDLALPVEGGVTITCRFHPGDRQWPWILFFHGNGEVVSDYDEIASFYHQRKLNLVVADYRGYGASGGIPTLTDLARDAQTIFERVQKELAEKGFISSIWVMGRSLGSISALELGYRNPDRIQGLIIESGFCSVVRITTHLGIPAPGIDLKKIDRECVEIIRKISIPVLIMHGEQDTLVPVQEAKDLFQHLGTDKKELLTIPRATHNDIMMVGSKKYFDTLQQFIERFSEKPGTL
jgi:alpha-beta hydrolase superfamily lysophospholipase